MKHIFIVNPVAGAADADSELTPKIQSYARKEGIDFEIHRTLNKQEVGSYSRQRAQQGESVRFYACGGDGTLCDVVNAVAGMKNVEVAVYPCGTGNDFVRNFTEKQNFLDFEKLIEGKAIPVDLIKHDRGYSINMLNIGVDCDVVVEADKIKRQKGLGGSASYIAGAFKVLSRGKTYHMSYEEDGELKEEEFFLVAIGNGRYCGGGFCSNPDASINDGEMDILLIRPVRGLKMLQMLLKYRNGTHMQDKSADKFIIFKRTDHFKLYPSEPVNVSIDGEVLPFEGGEFSMEKGAVNIVVPKGSALLSESERVDLG
ncbi:MAG: YegS/Rv2252/BmrU family lipid kinase [Firmicutes bacterium]|nr:YegS/Rv2252/BmrU family lipid kinase [Bacillota bacterium]